MKRPVRRYAKVTVIFSLVFIILLLIICIVFLPESILFLAIVLVLSALIIISCRDITMVLTVSPDGIAVTRRGKIVYSHSWDEIKAVDKCIVRRVGEIIYFSTNFLSPTEKRKIMFRSISKNFFYCYSYNDEEFFNYVKGLAQMKRAEEKPVVLDINRKKLERRYEFISFMVSSGVCLYLYLLLVMNLLSYAGECPPIFLLLIMIFIAVMIFSYIMFRRLRLYNRKLIYDGSKIKVCNNSSQETVCEFDVADTAQIGVVGKGKKKYIYFSDQKIENADKKIVFELYENPESNLVYCDYDYKFCKHLMVQYPEKFA